MDTFTWSLLGADAGDLDIDPMSGVLTFTQNSGLNAGPLPNFEAPQDDNTVGSNTYNIIVRGDRQPHESQTDYAVVITVTDVNEAPEFEGTPMVSVTYDENATTGRGGLRRTRRGTGRGHVVADGHGRE